MKLLKRNMTDFEYLPYKGIEEEINEYGLHTGISIVKYGDPIPYKGNISIPSGAVVQAFDGLEIRYTHVLLMDDPTVDIRESGKIQWKENTYQITAVRKSINSLSAALHAETVDNGDQPVGPEGED